MPRPSPRQNLATLSPRVVVFVVAMAAGMVLHDLWQKRPMLMRRQESLAAAAAADG